LCVKLMCRHMKHVFTAVVVDVEGPRYHGLLAAASLAVLVAFVAGWNNGASAERRDASAPARSAQAPARETRAPARETPAPARETQCDVRTSERVVAVGDVHGAYDAFRAILREARIIDTRDRWIGGRAILIQTGDVLDRGAHSRRVMDLLRRLERDAPRAGGRVYALLGNHELMRLVGDWRYVSPGEIKAFERPDSPDVREFIYERSLAAETARAKAEKRTLDQADYRERFLKEVPLGFLETRVAFEPKGEYGPWLRSRPTMVKVNGIAFLHGGVSDSVASLGCDGINEAVSKELAALPTEPQQVAALLGASETGPLWYRGLATEPEEAFAPTLTTILERVGARAFVIGHTPVTPGRIATRFGGRVIQIDAGMLNETFFPKGVASALEIHGDTLTAIYLGRRDPIAAPALQAAPLTAPVSR
jgi:hypothetical protein